MVRDGFMVIYVDILFLLNLLITYFLLSATRKICCSESSKWRIAASCVFGTASSLLIFLPEFGGFITGLLCRLIPAVIILLIAFGYKNTKYFLRNLFCFFVLSFLYYGVMMFVYSNNNSAVYINNGSVYVDISPILLVVSTLLCSLIIIIINSVFKRNSQSSKKCQVILNIDKNTVETVAMIDTGHCLKDNLSGNYVSVIDDNNNDEVLKRIKSLNKTEYKNRFRLIPCSTVTGEKILEAIRFDIMTIILNNKKYVIKNPVIAFTNTKMGDDFSMIVSPEIFSYKENRYEQFYNSYKKSNRKSEDKVRHS